MKREVLLTVLISGLCLIACNDDSSTSKQLSCKCPEGQVCDDNCQPKTPGNNDNYGDNHGDDHGDNHGDGNCNPACGEYEVCNNGTCVDPCNHTCKMNEVCIESHCVKKICANCGPNEECTDSGCVDKSRICSTPCIDDQVCINNECVLDCDKPCGTFCCGEGESCDGMLNWCMPTCEDGKPQCGQSCCKENQTCIAGIGCSDICTETQVSCLIPGHGICCEAGELCNLEEGMCGETCGGLEKCGEDCCPADETCVAGSCKIKCTDESLRCGLEGDICCDGATEVCLYNKCLPKKPCEKQTDCGFFESCESITHNCVDEAEIPNTCVVMPAEGDFAPKLQWFWPGVETGGVPIKNPEYMQVMMSPTVINMTDDNNDNVIDENDIPDVAIVAFETNGWNRTGVLRVLSGDTGKELASTDQALYYGESDVGAADVDGDGRPELVVTSATEFHIYELVKDSESTTGYKLNLKYKMKHTGTSPAVPYVSIADFEGDGIVEIVTIYGVINVINGELAWREGCRTGIGNAIPVDLDNDGVMELVTSGKVMNSHCVTLTPITGGQIAVADLMPDSANAAEIGELKPEIAHVVPGSMGGTFHFTKLYKNKETGVWTSSVKWNAPLPVDKARAKSKYGCTETNHSNGHCSTGGGAPVIADFNGDTIPDIGVASRYYYIVYSNDGTPDGGKVLWADGNIEDYSSAVTGSSVFDFEGDGKAEVVYADEKFLRVYRGKLLNEKDDNKDGYPDPEILYEIKNLSGTAMEYPVIVDVDNDGSTEIVVGYNDYQPKSQMSGVRAYEDPEGHWVRTRRIWNQHSYHVTNIEENGKLPEHEEPNWSNRRLNNYRQNVQPGGLFNAPNLIAESLTSSLGNSCPPINLTATVKNGGSLGVRAGVSVKFYVADVNGSGNTGYIGEAVVPKVLTPGESGTATFVWNQTATVGDETIKVDHGSKIYFVVDENSADKPKGEFIECMEDDNRSAIVTAASCPMG